MIRLFIAIEIPEPIKHYILGMGRTIPGARVVPEEQLHLTLKFIGEVEGSVLLDVAELLGNIRAQPCSLQLRGVGVFPPRKSPRVLWAGVEDNSADNSLLALRNSIDLELLKAGIPREKKKFTPHITLARLNNPPIRKVQEFLAGNAFFESPRFEVSSFSLYSSTLNVKGAIHRIENQYFL